MSRRGYAPEDEKQFTGNQLMILKKAAGEVQFLLDRGYDVKPVTTFVGNHYMLSERQRLALARSISPAEWVKKRNSKELLQKQEKSFPEIVHIDGFNTVITQGRGERIFIIWEMLGYEKDLGKEESDFSGGNRSAAASYRILVCK